MVEWVGQDCVGVKDHRLGGGDFTDVLLQGGVGGGRNLYGSAGMKVQGCE